MRVNNTIIKPIVTEKSLKNTENGVYVFMVKKAASKGAIANNLKEIYNVDAEEVNTVIMPGKARRVGRTNRYNDRETWKKAVVKIKKGQKIDLFEQTK